MNILHRIARGLRLFLQGGRVEAELSDELRHHIELEAEELLRQGWEPEAARREAFRRFGGEERTKEKIRDARGGRVLADLVQDVRYAMRSLRKTPAFSLSAILVIGLGVGASAAAAGLVRVVLLEPLPYGEPERLVRVWAASPDRENLREDISYPNFLDWAARTRTLSSMGAYTTFPADWSLVREGETAEEVRTAWVAGEFFRTMGTSPILGRALTLEDMEEGRAAVVLSEGAWRRLFGGDPGIVGRTVTLDFRSFEVVGVMPEHFAYPEPDLDVWVPLTTFNAVAFPYERRAIRFAFMVGRLAEGRTMVEAEAELSRIASDLEAIHPDNNAGQNAATVLDLREFLVGDVRVALWSLLGAVGFFLLLATANVANLLIARGLGRSREIALRRSLGASRGRVARQSLTETGLLVLLGATAAVGIAALLVAAVSNGATQLVPRVADFRMDAVTAFAILLASGLVAAVAGFWPALRGTASGTSAELRSGSRALGAASRGVRVRRWLVAGEVGLAAVLLVGAGLLLQSFGALLDVDSGFEPAGAAAMTVNIPFSRYAEDDAWATRHEEILAQLRAMPDIETTGAIAYLPVRSQGEGMSVTVEGIYEPPSGEGILPRVFPVTDGAFEALGMTLLAGRDFRPSDGPEDTRVAVVNEAFVLQVLQGRDAIGMRLANGPTQWEVVGVVGDVRHNGLAEPAPPAFYTHIRQSPRARQTYIARSSEEAGMPFASMRTAVEGVDPQLAISEMLPLENVTSEYRARPRVIAAVAAGFAGMALLLAVLGVYGVVSHVVRSRSREMGLRSALGAPRSRIARDVVAGGMGSALVGLTGGLLGAAFLSRYLESLLFEVEPLEIGTFTLGAILILGAAAVACGVPAVSAARVDPATALEAE